MGWFATKSNPNCFAFGKAQASHFLAVAHPPIADAMGCGGELRDGASQQVNLNCASHSFRHMLATARQQAGLAHAIYGGEGTFNSYARLAGAINSQYCVAGHVRAGWIKFPDHCHLAICGSDDLHDWVQNLSARQADHCGLKVHQGFMRSANWIVQELIRGPAGHMTAPLVLGGHSAGGAIAEILSLAPQFRPREIVTFGAPRVFAAESAATYRSQPWPVYRFVTAGDPVPGLPLREFRKLFGGARYSHASAPLELCSDGQILMDSAIGSGRRIVRMVASAWLYGMTVGALVTRKLPSLLEAHRIGRYVDYLETAVVRYQK